jgi:protein tyrosine/serine phosphatase
MTDMPRLHAFDGLTNFRDFGGYDAGGRRIVTGRFFRSANHALASEADLARLRDMGISAVVDLRRPQERDRAPSRRWDGFAAHVVENHDNDEGADSWDKFMTQWDMEAASYRDFLLRYYAEAPHLPRLLDLFTRYFDIVANSEGAVVVHCAAGKDRTGLIVALTHWLAGAHKDDIVADYLLTNTSGRFEAHGANWRAAILEQHGRAPTMEVMRAIMGVEAIFLERSFEVITERNGGVEGYLRDALGVDAAKRARIEARLFG